MLPCLDELIYTLYRNYLRSERDAYVARAIAAYKADKRCPPERLEEFQKKVTAELDIADSGILMPHIFKARIVFWISVTAVTLFLLGQGQEQGFNSEKKLNYFSPLVLAFLSWLDSLYNVTRFYRGQIQGSMSGVITTFRLPAKDEVAIEIDDENSDEKSYFSPP